MADNITVNLKMVKSEKVLEINRDQVFQEQ